MSDHHRQFTVRIQGTICLPEDDDVLKPDDLTKQLTKSIDRSGDGQTVVVEKAEGPVTGRVDGMDRIYEFNTTVRGRALPAITEDDLRNKFPASFSEMTLMGDQRSRITFTVSIDSELQAGPIGQGAGGQWLQEDVHKNGSGPALSEQLKELLDRIKNDDETEHQKGDGTVDRMDRWLRVGERFFKRYTMVVGFYDAAVGTVPTLIILGFYYAIVSLENMWGDGHNVAVVAGSGAYLAIVTLGNIARIAIRARMAKSFDVMRLPLYRATNDLALVMAVILVVCLAIIALDVTIL